jgi:surface antigen
MNKELSSAAISAISFGDYVTSPGLCQTFIRQVLKNMYLEDTYDAIIAPHMLSSASSSGRSFLYTDYVVTNDPEEGDLLYKTPGYGHVGIYVGDVYNDGNAYVAENSFTSIGRIRGALGYRNLTQFGSYQICVRLPDLDSWKIVFPDNQVIDAENKNDTLYVSIRDWGSILGLEVQWNGNVMLDGKYLTGGMEENGKMLFMFRYLAQIAGLSFKVKEDTRRVYIYKS